jgi:hypothetical protein
MTQPPKRFLIPQHRITMKTKNKMGGDKLGIEKNGDIFSGKPVPRRGLHCRM